MKKIFSLFVMMVCMLAIPVSVMGAKEKDVIIVIDPGHGGSQNGAEYNGLLEKDINMSVANALVEELEKYEGVKIYMTHESTDDEMSIQDRADYAKKVKADYFFSIHFNASGNHNFYGAETWVPSYGRYYSEMYAFSEIVMESFNELGIYDRGIKTKLETDGTDYYGVLRECAEYEIPSVIIEHCHMDNDMDAEFLDEDADFEKFGKIDAEAIAKFLGLKSEENDFSTYTIELPEEPEESIKNDETPPTCELTLVNIDDEAQQVNFRISAADEEYPILYYGYSLEGGENYSSLVKWDKDKDYMEFSLDIDTFVGDSIIAIVYNSYNLAGYSNEIFIAEILDEHNEKLEAEESAENMTLETVVTAKAQTGGEIYLIVAAIAILAALVVIILFVRDLSKNRE